MLESQRKNNFFSFYEFLKRKLGEEAEFHIEEVLEDFNGLISRETAARIVCLKLGLVEETLSEEEVINLKGVVNRWLRVKIKTISWKRRDKKGRIYIVVGFEKTRAVWYKDVPILLGDEIEIRNFRVHDGIIFVDEKTKLKLIKRPSPIPVYLLKPGWYPLVRGTLKLLGKTFYLEDGGVKIPIIASTDLTKFIGKEIIIENCWMKEKTLDCRESRRIFVRRS